MRVLVASKFWYPRGGLERVMLDEVAMLEADGHSVAHFSAAHPLNIASPWESYFVPYLELGAGARLSGADKARAAARLFHNGVAARAMAALVEEFRPDVVHIHGIHRQISPSILGVTRSLGLPVVQTLHDYHHVCPADVLLRGDGTVCDPRACGTYDYSAAVRYRCVRGSVAASALSAAEVAFQRIRGVYERGVTRFISPSRFLADLMVGGGWKTPTVVLPNPVDVSARPENPHGGRGFVYLGRLSREKGVDVFLAAASRAGVEATVVGTGPLAGDLRADFPDVTFTGHMGPDEVAGVLSAARASVVPSVWFENAPMSVLESLAAGIPVVASRIGGIPELVEDGREGLLVQPGAVSELADALRRLEDDDRLARSLGEAGRARAARQFSKASHLEGLLAVYEDAITSRRSV